MVVVVLLSVAFFVLVFFFIRMPQVMLRLFSNGIVRLTIGVLFLFFFNVFGATFGLHIPINVFTILISTVLGFFGVISLGAIQLFIFG